jgi:hypothetical protein
MKLINSESLVFTNVSINPVFQILGDDRWASRSHSIVHICPSPIKEMTTLTHIPLIHDTFPMHFDKLVMDFGRANVFRVQKSNRISAGRMFFAFKNGITEHTSQSSGLVIDMVLYKAL